MNLMLGVAQVDVANPLARNLASIDIRTLVTRTIFPNRKNLRLVFQVWVCVSIVVVTTIAAAFVSGTLQVSLLLTIVLN